MSTILDAIGSTPLVEIRRLAPAGSARIFVKIEGANPTGSKKDRMALEIIGAESRGNPLRMRQPLRGGAMWVPAA